MKKVLLVLLLLVLFGCAETSKTSDLPTRDIIFYTENKEISVQVEVPQTSEQKMKGLMFREEMDEFEGMLFLFNTMQKHQFWMKNTLLPLDLIHISDRGEIVDIIKADPCKSDPCARYTPRAESRFVVEVNQNFTDRHGIEVGDLVQLN